MQDKCSPLHILSGLWDTKFILINFWRKLYFVTCHNDANFRCQYEQMKVHLTSHTHWVASCLWLALSYNRVESCRVLSVPGGAVPRVDAWNANTTIPHNWVPFPSCPSTYHALWPTFVVWDVTAKLAWISSTFFTIPWVKDSFLLWILTTSAYYFPSFRQAVW